MIPNFFRSSYVAPRTLLKIFTKNKKRQDKSHLFFILLTFYTQTGTIPFQQLVFPEGNPDSLIVDKSGQRFIRVIFNGAQATGSPLIARMAVEKGIEANIAYASTRSIGGKAYGSMLLGISGGEKDVRTAIEYMTGIPDVLAEEVTINV